MKKMVTILAAVMAAAVLAAPAMAGLAGSRHDFTATGGTPVTGVTEMCVTCHVPHRPLMNVPLWAHALSTYSYQLYNTNASYNRPNSAAYDASPANLSGSRSRLCLSCHDGTVAVAGTTYIPATDSHNILWSDGAATGGQGSANPNPGLKGSHPIAVNYATVRTNQPTEFKDITADPDVKLELSKVQCTSCHNPHNKFSNMLVKSNAGSAVCLTCHNK